MRPARKRPAPSDWLDARDFARSARYLLGPFAQFGDGLRQNLGDAADDEEASNPPETMEKARIVRLQNRVASPSSSATNPNASPLFSLKSTISSSAWLRERLEELRPYKAYRLPFVRFAAKRRDFSPKSG